MTDRGPGIVATHAAALALLLAAVSRLFGADTSATPGNLRRPVALEFDQSSERLLIANSQTGSIAVINAETLELSNEQTVCTEIADFLAIPGTKSWLALDSADNRLLLIDDGETGFRVADDVAIPPAPARLTVSGDAELACLSCVWSRSVTLVAIDADQQTLEILQTLNLPFPPRELLLIDDDQRLLVAGAFRGELAVVNLELRWVESVREIRGHNIRGLALSADADEVYVAHQQLHRLARSDFDDIHWGNLITNGLRAIPVQALLDAGQDLNGFRLRSIGGVADAAGDPGRLLVVSPERTIVALAGVGEVGLGHPDTGFTRMDVGLLPGALAVDPGRNRLFVANRLDDSIAVIDLNSEVPEQTIPLGPAAELTPAERGEQLFFNARLSHDRWMSCHTCHSNGHTVDLAVDTLGDGDYGAPKRIPSLLGVGETAPYAWNGSLATLEQQIRKSVTTTMHGYELADEDVAALAAFLRTLEPPPGGTHLDETAVERGRKFFEESRCARCHTPPLYTSDGTYDVGLSDERNRSDFNPPSLRGVSQRERFLHDGRAESLEDLFRVHQHQIDEPVDDRQLADLVQFLRSL